MINHIFIRTSELSYIHTKTPIYSIGYFRVLLCLYFKASLSTKHSYENDFDLHENLTVCRTHFHTKGFALRLVLK